MKKHMRDAGSGTPLMKKDMRDAGSGNHAVLHAFGIATKIVRNPLYFTAFCNHPVWLHHLAIATEIANNPLYFTALCSRQVRLHDAPCVGNRNRHRAKPIVFYSIPHPPGAAP